MLRTLYLDSRLYYCDTVDERFKRKKQVSVNISFCKLENHANDTNFRHLALTIFDKRSRNNHADEAVPRSY